MIKTLDSLSNNAAFSGASHDIKTLANGVMCMSSLLEITSLSIEQAEIVHLLKKSAEELSLIMAQVLENTQPKTSISVGVPSEKSAPNESFRVKEVLETIFNTFSLTIQDKPIVTKLVIGGRIPSAIKGDKTALNRILTNLLQNAGKFTQSGSIELHISKGTPTEKAEKQRNGQTNLIFQVKDTGMGIEPQHLNTIFNRFTKFNSTGYGIGLATVKELVETQGGTISVESTLNLGTVFSISIPYQITQISRETLMEKARHPKGLQWRKLINTNMTVLKNKRILIADDDAVYLKYLTTLLQQSGTQILTVKTGNEALDLTAIQRFDLILIDLQLPDMDGYEVSFQIRNTLNINRHTAIVGMTAGDIERERRIASDMDDVLPKPMNTEGLINRLERVLVFEKTDMLFDKTYEIDAFEFDTRLCSLHLKELYGADTEHAALMFETFLEESLPQWDDIWTLLESDNRMKIKEKAHRLKPAFSMVGLTQVESKLKDLERNIFNYSYPKLKTILTDIEKIITAFIPILENELERLQCDFILEAA